MKPSDLGSIIELSQAALCAAILEHLRMTRPSDAEDLHRVAWIAAKCALAGHTECELRVPPALMRGGEECMAVRDIVSELRMEALLGLPPAAATKAEGRAAMPVNGRPVTPQEEAGPTGLDGAIAG